MYVIIFYRAVTYSPDLVLASYIDYGVLYDSLQL